MPHDMPSRPCPLPRLCRRLVTGSCRCRSRSSGCGLNQFEPQSAFYHMPVALWLEGPLDIAVLDRSLREIVRRHEALRTTFPSIEGQPHQIIAKEVGLALPIVDLTTLAAEAQAQEVERLATEEAHRLFDLARGPLVRTTILQLSDRKHVLLVTMHHIVSDGWSTGVALRELTALYDAFSAGRLSPLPELTVQYADFALWQRQWLSGQVLQMQVGYWRQQLAGAPPMLDLPTDWPRPPVQTFRGDTHPLALPGELFRAL